VNRTLRVSAAVVALYLLVALAAPLVAPYDPYAYSARPYEAPSARHLLGANDVGQDTLSELIFGTRVSLAVAAFAGASAVLIGAAVGLLAGARRGVVDAIAMRIVDVFLTLPRLPLIIVVAAYLGGGTLTIIGILVFFAWPATARIVRAQTLSVSRLEYVQASRAIGAGELQVICRHLIPVATPVLAAAFVSNAGRAVLLESGLAFLGLGDATVKSWGAMLFFALRDPAVYFTGRWAWSILPAALALSALLFAIALAGIAMEARSDRRIGGDTARRVGRTRP
jgi:ABC-type dipeptide/oligopeptide/nickel transport system permease subunit